MRTFFLKFLSKSNLCDRLYCFLAEVRREALIDIFEISDVNVNDVEAKTKPYRNRCQ